MGIKKRKKNKCLKPLIFTNIIYIINPDDLIDEDKERFTGIKKKTKYELPKSNVKIPEKVNRR